MNIRFDQILKHMPKPQTCTDSPQTLSALTKIKIEKEREQIASGEKPKPIFPDRQQNGAVRLLAVFFAVILLFTVLSRVAAGLVIADVTTQKMKSGVLTQRYTLSGNISAQNTIDLMLPANIKINSVFAEKGDHVESGDALLQLDPEDIKTEISQLQSEIQILNQKIANYTTAVSIAPDEQIKQAEEKVKAAQEDYDLVLRSLELSANRSDEDIQKAQQDYEDALSNLETAEHQAKKNQIDEARQKLDDAEKALEDALYNSDSSIASAQNAVELAQESAATAQRKYNNAVTVYEDANKKLTEAKEHLSDITSQDPPASEKEIEEAEKAVATAQSECDSARIALDDASDANDQAAEAVRRAQEELDRTTQRQQQLVGHAEDSVGDAEHDLYSARRNDDLSSDASVSSAQSGVDSAQSSLQTANRNDEDLDLSSEEKIRNAQRAIDSAKSDLKIAKEQAAKTRQDNELSRLQNESEKLTCSRELKEKQELLKLLETINQNDGAVLSTVSGTVKSIPEETGLIADDSSKITIARTDQNFQFSALADEETAQQIAIGDEGTLSFTVGGKSQSVPAQVSSVGTPNEDGKIRIIVELTEGNFSSESSADFEIEKQSEPYQTILPISALRNVDGKSVVFVVREKQSVLGTEQTVEAIEVTVKEQDSENMAIESAVLPDDQIVATSSKPVQKGDRVRVVES